MISIDSIYKEFPNKILFNNISIKFKEGMRVGLVGPNGSGKSTLLKIITGIEKPSGGTVDIGNLINIGYLPQEIIAGTKRSIIEEALSAFPAISKLESEINNINYKIAIGENNSGNLLKLSELQEKMDTLDGWSIEEKAKKILGGLGFSNDQFLKPFNSFSGGWRMRCYLAGILLKNPNYLFFDEPTNHLDLDAIVWLENFLSKWKGGLILISHDRKFLDKSINSILEIEFEKVRLYSGNYSFYINKKQELIQHHQNRYNNQQKEIIQTEKFIERFRAKNTKAKQVQSRVKKLEKMEKLQKIDSSNKKINFKIPQPERGPLKVVNLINVNKAYGQNSIYDNLNLVIDRGNKIGLVGKNGSGKSTLLKILAKVEGITSGEIIFGPNIKIKYYGQHQVETLNIEMTLYETIYSISGGWSETQVRTYLGSFLFSGDMIENKVKVLSGGEKARLALACLLVEPAHLLLLDEPTNHLDIISRDIIENAFKQYTGTIVCISHDRHFLNSVTTSIIEVENTSVRMFDGNYDYYYWKISEINKDEGQDDNVSKSLQSLAKKDIYKLRKMRNNRLTKIKKRIKEVDDELNDIILELKNINNGTNYKKLQELESKQNNFELEYIELIEEKENLENLD